MRKILLATVAVAAFATSAHAGCVIHDSDPPTNVRTQPNGVIIGHLINGNQVRIIDQVRAHDGLWDYVTLVEDHDSQAPEGWVYDPLVRCH